MSETDVLDAVRAVLVDLLAVDPTSITRETRLEDLGCDSLDVVEIAIELEDRFDIALEGRHAVLPDDTVGSVVDRLCEAEAERLRQAARSVT